MKTNQADADTLETILSSNLQRKKKKSESKTSEVNDEEETNSWITLPSAPRSTHQFLSDFFRTDIMNHCEFLKQLVGLQSADVYLISEICERIAAETNHKALLSLDPPFYGGADAVSAAQVGHIARDGFQTHKSFPRNCYNIMMTYAALNQLKGHVYNIYELAYLNYHSTIPFRTAIFIFLIQITILWIVLQANLERYDTAIAQREPLVIIIDVCTTLFFTSFCYGQYRNATTFNSAVKGVIGSYKVADEDTVSQIDNPNERGKWQPELMLLINTLINRYLLILAPMFNFYFILLSVSAMDALLNSFSLLFIFELDDYVMPLFARVDIEDKLVINAHDFIMVPAVDGELVCRRTGPAIMPNGNKLYVSLQKETKSITIYSRKSALQYDKTIYVFDGLKSKKFLSMCNESLKSLQNFKDIHD
eukprot:559503_1